MKTKSHSKKEIQAKETHRKILTASAKLFARHGYHKTTINDIAQAIQLTSGAIFHHFPSKEALLREVIDWLARGINIYSRHLNRAEKGSLSVVEEMLKIMCDHFKRHPEATICLAALATEFAGSDHPVERQLKEIYEDFVESFSGMLKNHPKVKNPRAAAIAFVGAVQGIAVQGLVRENEQSIYELAEAFSSMLAEW